METKKLGRSDIDVTPLAFGAWAIGGWMWGGSDTKEALKAIETAVDNGMTTIDTASVYGFGLSEELVGKALKGKRHNVQILTKTGMSWSGTEGEFFFTTKDNGGNEVKIYKNSSRQKILKDCDESLRRLKTDYIDLFQIHWPDATTPVSETMEALSVLVSQGKIRAAGVSNFSVDLMKDSENTFALASNQVPYSMLNRGIEKEIVPYCIKKNIGIIAYSPLQRGLLAGRIRQGHQFSDGDTRPSTYYYKEPNLSRIIGFNEKMKEIADERNITLSQLVLNWTMQQPGISCTLAGARNAGQVLENIKAASLTLSGDEIDRINSFLSEVKLETNI